MTPVDDRLSVVITCFSEGNLLLEAVDSVFNQSVLPLEIILVNDAATDPATIAACQTLQQNPGVQVIWRAINGGPSVAREDGFRAAQGEILVPLDADDLLPDKALEIIGNAFTAFPDAGFIYGNYIRQDHPGEQQVVNPGDISLAHMLSSKRFSPSSQWSLIGTAPLRRSLWQLLGGCDPNLGREDLHDLEFWIRAIAHPACHYYYLPEIIYIWRRYLGKNSRQVNPLSWYRIAQKHLEVYRHVGLEYRAYELLLLGSKWMGDRSQIQFYSRQLIRCLCQGTFRIPTILALLVPAPLFRVLANYAGKRR